MSDLAFVASPYPHKADLKMVQEYAEIGVTEFALMAYPETYESLEGLLEELARQYMDPNMPGTARLS
jgi:hypothetical protein